MLLRLLLFTVDLKLLDDSCGSVFLSTSTWGIEALVVAVAAFWLNMRKRFANAACTASGFWSRLMR